MTNRTFERGEIVLIRRPRNEGGPTSAEVLTFKPTAQGGELGIVWRHSGQKGTVEAGVVERPCRRRAGCITLRDECRHCLEHRADPHLPGCPHGEEGAGSPGSGTESLALQDVRSHQA